MLAQLQNVRTVKTAPFCIVILAILVTITLLRNANFYQSFNVNLNIFSSKGSTDVVKIIDILKMNPTTKKTPIKVDHDYASYVDETNGKDVSESVEETTTTTRRTTIAPTTTATPSTAISTNLTITNATKSPFRYFEETKMNRTTMLSILADLKIVSDYLTNKLKVSWLIWGGTLLGYQRCGGFLPWDDDIDIFVPVNVSKILRKQFNCTKHVLKRLLCRGLDTFTYKIIEDDGDYFVTDAKAPQHLTQKQVRDKWSFPVNTTFPLVKANFNNVTVFIPKHHEIWSARVYGGKWKTECESNDYNHQDGHVMRKVKKIPCSELMKRYTCPTFTAAEVDEEVERQLH